MAAATIDIHELHDRIADDPLGFYRHYLPDLRRSGANWKKICPLHGDSNASFTVFPDGRWRCFGCQRRGDGMDLIEALQGIPFAEAVRQVAAVFGGADVPRPAPRAATQRKATPDAEPIPLATVEECHERLMQSDAALRWLQRKGLTLEIIQAAKIGIHPRHWHGGSRFTIPSPFADGREDAFADVRGYRPGATDGKVRPWSAGRGNRLFPWPFVSSERRIVCCEGEIDALGLQGRGIPAVTAHCGVDGFLALQLPDLTGKEFVVLGDHDDAGDKLRAQLPARLYAAGAATVTVARWPAESPKGFDVADFLATGPTDEELKEALGYAD